MGREFFIAMDGEQLKWKVDDFHHLSLTETGELDVPDNRIIWNQEAWYILGRQKEVNIDFDGWESIPFKKDCQ